jgi:predicted signal transduction protein with EAL and GGDEF domain
MHASLNRTNQSSFLHALGADMAAAAPGVLGLLLVQLNAIGELNRRLGYREVDVLLDVLARELSGGFPRHKVVRIGTARFAIVLHELKNEAHALLAANKVQRLVTAPLQLGGATVTPTVVQGVALAPHHAGNAEGLLRCAEAALEAALGGRDGIVLFSPTENSQRIKLVAIDDELTRVLSNGGIDVAFQPQIEVASGRTLGAEALLRCRGESCDWLPPELVIRSAERTGRLALVTSSILHTALRYAADWPDRAMGLSINVSTPSLLEPDFVATIESAAKIWNRPLETLTIELTETTIMDSPEQSFATMHRLRELGARVSLDDFGTGYSSLAYFKGIPANELKIDKSFVMNMRTEPHDCAIVDTVIKLAHAFGLSVVAEGVEDVETLAALRDLRCDVAQGYFFSRPLLNAAYASWLSTRDRPAQ